MDTWKRHFWNPDERLNIAEGDKKGASHHFQRCQRLMVRVQHSPDGWIEQRYKFGHGQDKTRTGRTYLDQSFDGGTSGYQILPGKLRGLLADAVDLIDIDMKNAHPTFLLATAKKLGGLPHSVLQQYVEHRAQFLQDNNIDKHYILEGMYKDTIPTSPKPPPQVKALFEEMKAIMTAIWVQSDGDGAFAEIPKNTSKKYNKLSSFGSRVLCTAENAYLQPSMALAERCGFKCQVPMFDGFMMSFSAESQPAVPELLTQLDEVTVGVGVAWSQKPHNTMVQMPADYQLVDTTQFSYPAQKYRLENERGLAYIEVGNKFLTTMMKIDGSRRMIMDDKHAWAKLANVLVEPPNYVPFRRLKCRLNQDVGKLSLGVLNQDAGQSAVP